ncbi:MAG: hypothetical protein M3136_07800, partial [Thermoproteota archaeon]|nr:hypothetical protein [Thermoproteota archaeon]
RYRFIFATMRVPPPTTQIHAQTDRSGDVGDGGDIFRLSRKTMTARCLIPEDTISIHKMLNLLF